MSASTVPPLRANIVTLGVADLPRARRFYESMGWTASSVSQDAIAFFQVGGVVVALYGRAALAEDANVADGQGFGGVTLACNVADKDEVRAVMERALSAGATALKEPQDVFWGGYHAYFADPDGHVWEVAWNPGLLPDATGQVRLPD